MRLVGAVRGYCAIAFFRGEDARARRVPLCTVCLRHARRVALGAPRASACRSLSGWLLVFPGGCLWLVLHGSGHAAVWRLRWVCYWRDPALLRGVARGWASAFGVLPWCSRLADAGGRAVLAVWAARRAYAVGGLGFEGRVATGDGLLCIPADTTR